MISRICLVAGLLAAFSLQAQPPAADSNAVAATVRAFHQALAGGDSTAALRLLAPDAMILENGSRESRDEYRAHHLREDIEFARAVASEKSPLQVTLVGDAAWVSSTSVTQGTYRDRAIDSVGAELMVLSRTASGWVIRAIHWSSRMRRAGG